MGIAELRQCMSQFPEGITEVVSGGARGIDQAGEWWAATKGIPVKVFCADWAVLGKGAGMHRNVEMAKYADCLVAIWDGKSSGTKHMIETMHGMKKPYTCVIL